MKQGKLRGIHVQSTRSRIREEERDPNLFYYEMRHGDSESKLCTVEKDVFVNFYGTFVAKQEIPLDVEPSDNYPDWHGINFDNPDSKHERKAVGNRSYDTDLEPWDN